MNLNLVKKKKKKEECGKHVYFVVPSKRSKVLVE
jgi:hypothetical protein